MFSEDDRKINSMSPKLTVFNPLTVEFFLKPSLKVFIHFQLTRVYSCLGSPHLNNDCIITMPCVDLDISWDISALSAIEMHCIILCYINFLFYSILFYSIIHRCVTVFLCPSFLRICAKERDYLKQQNGTTHTATAKIGFLL